MSFIPGPALLATARQLIERPDSELAGFRQRAADLLARDALEEAVADVLARRAAGAEQASAHAQMLCLPTYAPVSPAREARFLWGALSRASHHHPYELAPTTQELVRWVSGVERVSQAITPTVSTSPAAEET